MNENGDVDTVGKFQGYHTKSASLKASAELATVYMRRKQTPRDG
jgi:hypothetical protein